MKISKILTIVTAAALIGCGGGTGPSPDSPDQPNPNNPNNPGQTDNGLTANFDYELPSALASGATVKLEVNGVVHDKCPAMGTACAFEHELDGPGEVKLVVERENALFAKLPQMVDVSGDFSPRHANDQWGLHKNGYYRSEITGDTFRIEIEEAHDGRICLNHSGDIYYAQQNGTEFLFSLANSEIRLSINTDDWSITEKAYRDGEFNGEDRLVFERPL